VGSLPAANLPTPAQAVKPASEPNRPAAADDRAGQTSQATPALPSEDPYALISQANLLATLEDLTAIQPHSGWRNSGTVGEAEALDYMANRLAELEYLQDLGLELERQDFRVFMATELWETRLTLTVDGEATEVPADGMRGHRDNIAQALRFDSDGALNDTRRDPVALERPVVAVGTRQELDALGPEDVEGKVLLVDYAVVDFFTNGNQQSARNVAALLAKRPAGIVFVTRFSNQPRESHGTFAGEGSIFNEVNEAWAPPTLVVRLEDLAGLGIQSWDDLARVESAGLTWDADMLSPAASGNLAARIPGRDPARAVLLGAHIDSPNAPGALDDGSGSAVLLEVARVLDAGRVQPESDVYLVWFGSEELGLYGSYHFAATHQDLLDRTLAMLQVDMLSYPLDGIQAGLDLVTWGYGRLGESRLAWPEYLAAEAAKRGVESRPVNCYGLESDNSAFAGFDVPNANLIYKNDQQMGMYGPIHYATHVHDPYDTVALAREVADVFEHMARVALTAALEAGRAAADLRVAPVSVHRAVFVASHTEPVHVGPTTFVDMGMALAMAGFDVDILPYGQAVTVEALAGADLVVALPVIDYPAADAGPGAYDEAWTEAEMAALEDYAAAGGLLVLTNSAHRLKYGNTVLDENEDWQDANALAERFGVTYRAGTWPADRPAATDGEGPLTAGLEHLELADGNGVPFSIDGAGQAQVLAQVEGAPAAALLSYGEAGGEVLALADVGMLGAEWGQPANLGFWQNLAVYAGSR
jgi:hypothetical protein